MLTSDNYIDKCKLVIKEVNGQMKTLQTYKEAINSDFDKARERFNKG